MEPTVAQPLSASQIIGIVFSIATPFAGALYGVFKYSVGRNIASMDKGYSDLKRQVASVEAKLDELKHSYGKEGMTRAECSVCRKECLDQTARRQNEILEWMRRQDDKADRILMMVADRNRRQCFDDGEDR